MSDSSLIATAMRIKKRFKIGLLRQLWQAAYLRFNECRLDPWEYYFFEVYLDDYSMPQKRRFAGWRREVHMDRSLNSGPERDIANDKLAFYSMMRAHGAPVPDLKAVYRGNGHSDTGTVLLKDPNDIVDFVRDPAHAPFFAKPVRGAQGRNVWAIEGPAEDRDTLATLHGGRIGIRAFCEALTADQCGGVLFQELLRTHADIAQLSGNRLSSLRIVVILTAAGSEVLSAVWKVPTGDNISDNFDIGRSGNIIADVDLRTGRIGRAVRGDHWRNIPVAAHPDSGITFDAFRLPDWPRAMDLCIAHARQFPGLRLQHWDIALTDRGPVILELNVSGGMRTHQIVRRRGIVDPRLRALEITYA